MSAYLSLAHDNLREQAQFFINQFHLQLDNSHLPRLHLTENGLQLLDEHAKAIGMDWNDKHWKQRAKGLRGSDPLIKATLAGQKIQILDITAGWGKDALLMAQAGAKVCMLERNPYMAALLYDSHQRLENKDLQSRIKVIWHEAQNYLQDLSPEHFPDVIYIDPMHPKRDKTAQVKKHLQVLQYFIAPNEDVLELINLAKQKAKLRVVLKWPAKQHLPLKADYTNSGKTIQYAIYQPNH